MSNANALIDACDNCYVITYDPGTIYTHRYSIYPEVEECELSSDSMRHDRQHWVQYYYLQIWRKHEQGHWYSTFGGQYRLDLGKFYIWSDRPTDEEGHEALMELFNKQFPGIRLSTDPIGTRDEECSDLLIPDAGMSLPYCPICTK